ncbi:MAG: ATP-binding protein [Myxococcales bacterium]|nr:ATP-binding protein [Myxococcales bacterium]
MESQPGEENHNEPEAAELRAALDRIVAESVGPVASWGAGLYLLFAVGHHLVLPEALRSVIAPIALATSLYCVLLRLWVAKRGIAPASGHAVMGSLLALALFNSALHLQLQGAPEQTTNLIVVMVAVSLLLLSYRWFAGVAVAVWGSWLSIAALAPPWSQWSHFGFALLSATVLGAVVLAARIRGYLRLERTRGEAERANARSQRSLRLAEAELQRRKQVEDELRRARDGLEQRVLERTTELQAEIEERKRTEHELRKSEEALQHARRLESLGRLVGGIAHEFNNLLSVIGAHTAVILEEYDDPELAEDLGQVQHAVKRASELTSSLLAFGRRQVLSPRSVRLAEVAEHTARMMSPVVGRTIHLRTELDDGAPPVWADPGQIEQIIVNLVMNARDAMPDGGELTIRTGTATLDPDSNRSMHGLRAGRYGVLSVCDTGAGMDPETAERIFEPFFTTKGSGQGTGLGLSTVYGIANQSGGGVLMHTRPGVGTTFCVYLPHDPQPTVASQRADPTASAT